MEKQTQHSNQKRKSKGPMYKDGQILKRSQILKRWNTRRILLKYNDKTLEILSDKQNNSKIINLTQYQIKWLDQYSEKSPLFAFKFIATNQKDKKLKYKSIYFASKVRDDAYNWYEQLKQFTPNLQHSIFDPSSNFSDLSQVKQTQGLRRPTIELIDIDEEEICHSQRLVKVNGNYQTTDFSPKRIDFTQNKLEDMLPTNIDEQMLSPNLQERKEDEYVKLPYYSTNNKQKQWPQAIDPLEQKKVQEIIDLAPEPFKYKVQKILTWFSSKNGKDFWSVTNNKYEQISQTQDQSNQIQFRKKKNPHKYRGIMSCKNTPMELYEEFNIPSTQKHWHPSILNYEIYPEFNMNCDLVKITLDFKKSQTNEKTKTVFFHRYGFQFNNAYFIISKTFGTDHTEETYDHNFQSAHYIFKNPENPESVIILTDLELQFKGESDEILKHNTIDFLQQLNQVDHEPIEFKNDKNYILTFQVFGDEEKIKETMGEENLTQIEIEKDQPDSNDNAKIQNELEDLDDNDYEEEEEKDNISINIGFQKVKPDASSSFQIYKNRSLQFGRSFTLGNAEIPFNKEEFLQLLEKIEKNQIVTDCVSNYQELDYIEETEVKKLQTTDEDGHYAFKKQYVHCEKNGGIILIDSKFIKAQRTVLIALMKRIGSNFMSGKSIMGISMPVSIFEKRSMLQRMARAFGSAPTLLKQAGLEDDVVEQIKYTFAFQLSSFILQGEQTKPFNPIIGETSQGRLNGYPIYFEQISHHPPVSTYIHYGPNYQLFGSHSPEVSMHANSLDCYPRCHFKVKFPKTNTTLYVIQSQFALYGTAMGSRVMNCVGRSYIFDPESKICMESIYNPYDKGAITNFFSKKKHKIDEMAGAIYKVKPHFIDQLLEIHKPYSPLSKYSNIKLNPSTDVEQFLSKMEGNWNQFLQFDGEEYWNSNDTEYFPFQLDYEVNPLPSDSQFRPDLIWLSLKNEDKSQETKEAFEEKQRKDEKLRKKYRKNYSQNLSQKKLN